MAYSICLRLCLLNDGDLRNGNAGVVLNKKMKSARVAPNHDFGELFDPDMRDEKKRFDLLDEWSEIYPNDFIDFCDKSLNFVAREKGKPSICEKMIGQFIRESNVRELVANSIFENVLAIDQKDLQLSEMASV